MEDEQIISLFFARDEQAIAETNRKYGGLCRKIGIRILGSEQDAEECCNDVLLKAWNAIPPEHPQHLSAYLSRLMRNVSLQLYEKLHALKRGGTQTAVVLDELSECLPAEDDVERQVSEAETGAMLRKFLQTLPEETRTIMVLRYYYMMPVRDIAERCHISVSKVKITLYRTRNALKKHLGGEE